MLDDPTPGTTAEHDTDDTDEADVVVVGGGTGGITAALAAAELGASVVVVDRDSGLGGVGTRAGIHLYYWGQRGGLQDALDKQVRAVTAAEWGTVRGFHPLAKQVTVETRLAEAGVTVIYEAVVSRVRLTDSRVRAVDVEHPEGSLRIRTRTLIDATGNGDVAALCGARYHVGRDWDQVMNTYSFVPRFVDDRDQLTFANFDCGWLDSTSPDDVSRALAHGRRVGLARVRANPEHVPLSLGPQLGVREGRRVVGDETVAQADVFAQRVREDTVFRCRTHHDTHARDYANESDLAQIWVPVLGWRKRGFRGDIPYGALLPAGIDGLLIGCRAISGDQDVAAGVRMQRDMHRLGEVAGAAAALAVRLGVTPREVPVARLQAHLRSCGVLDDLPTTTVPDGPRSQEEALAALGTEDESAGLWWSLTHQEAPREPLLALLKDDAPRRRRGAAFALGLLGDMAGLRALREVFVAGDEDAPGDPRGDLAAPRWLAALVLLRTHRDPGVLDPAIDRLPHVPDSATALYLLHYVHDLADRTTPGQRADALRAIDELLARPGLGDDFAVQSSERADHRAATQSSIRWNIELTASATVEALGGDGAPLRERWRSSPHGAARRFARHLERPGAGPETQVPLAPRTADVVVAGGGLAGVAAALEAAAEPGRRVILVEPGPVLGREITAARRTAVGTDTLTEPVLAALAAHGCVSEGHVDALAASVALDEMCGAAGVEVLLHAFPGDALVERDAVVGLTVTTVAGPLTIRTPLVVDATVAGRVRAPWAPTTSRDELTGIALVVRHAAVAAESRWRPAGSAPGTEAVLTPLPRAGWARLRFVTRADAIPPAGIAALAATAFDEARATRPELAAAVLALPADEPLDPVRGRRRVHGVGRTPVGLVGAGASLPEAPAVTADDREVLEHLAASGRAAVSGVSASR